MVVVRQAGFLKPAGFRIAIPPALIARGVRFGYPGRPLLRQIDLTVPAGSLTAVVGRSGSGKTTLRRLMQGELRAQHGWIELGHQGQGKPRVRSVPQELPRLRGHVADALIASPSQCDLASVVELCDRLGMLPWIEQLPEGLLTHCSRIGPRLSTAARRQIALARGLIEDPDLLLLDEPLLWLDAEMEQRLHRVLRERQQRGQTTVVFMHRLGGTMQCTQIALLEDGTVVECGNHLELMNRSGAYHGMWLDQLPIAALEELVPWRERRG